MIRGQYLSKFAVVLFAGVIVLFSSIFAGAQQTDVAVGAGILLSTKNISASQSYLPPPEKGGLYPSFSIVHIRPDRFGYSGEFTYAYKEHLYNGYQEYRPILYDFNAVFAPHVTNRADAEIMGGVGGQTVIFYNIYGSCGFASGCSTHLNSNEFLFHASLGIRYRIFRSYFVRPEAHLYHIVNNSNFHSDNVFRVGASVGYTFGQK